MRLYKFNEIPEWQRDNNYVISGYLGETRSVRTCLKSLFVLHNESVNIHTHLLPATVFIASPFLLQKYFPIFTTTTAIDYWVYAAFLAGFVGCLLLSSTFHCVKCHSYHVAVNFNKADYFGIILLISCSTISIVYYALIDQPKSRITCNTITLAFAGICSAVSLGETFRHPDWRQVRATMFILFGLSGILPILVGLIELGRVEVIQRSNLKWVILEGALYIFGATLYAMRVPERFNPGKFDNFGHSHQIFHILVVAAGLCHGTALYKSYVNAHHNILGGVLIENV